MKKPAPARPIRALVVISLAVFLVQFDIAAVVIAMPPIAAELELDRAGFAWVMDAYSLAFVGLLMAAGALADRYGRRRVLAAGIVAFAIASLGCAAATGAALLLLARAGQGVGAALVVCGGLALLSELYRASRARAWAFGVTGTISGVAMAFGPAGGGAIAATLGWRWIFLINLPICLGVTLALPRVVDESRDPQGRPIDLAGTALLTAALGILIATLLHAGASGWGRSTLSALAVALALLAILLAVERTRVHPAIDLALLRAPAFAGICLVALLMSVSYWSVLVYLPPYAAAALGLAPAEIGAAMLAATVPMLVLPPLGARLAARLPPHVLFALGFALNVTGDVVLAIGADHVSLALSLAGMALAGGGTGLVNAQISSLAVALAPSARAGVASGIAVVMRQSGFALGIAALGTAAPSFALLFSAAAAAGVAGLLAVLALLRGAAAHASPSGAS